ncbi:hypothetical protein M885DRAFT_514537 [Pelagophyceae sp. CCMP2097]|nr:hypothetical protein M885DRAFT_514537 [Pelagophyceae sp. CCMP2097]
MAKPVQQPHGAVAMGHSAAAAELTADAAARGAWTTALELLMEHDANTVAVVAGDGRADLTYGALCSFIRRAALPGLPRCGRVAVVVPSGPALAVAFVALSRHCTLAPLNVELARAEVAFELDDLPACAVVVLRGCTAPGSAVARDEAALRGIPVLTMTLDDATVGLFSLSLPGGGDAFTCSRDALAAKPPRGFAAQHDDDDEEDPFRAAADARAGRAPSGARGAGGRRDVALVLHTSGTTKRPKLVPLTHENLVAGALCIARTLRLDGNSFCVNVMPLFHIHGLSVNVLATLLAGGRVSIERRLEPQRFFDALLGNGDGFRPNWYSAVPTMHHAILLYGDALPSSGRAMRLDFARNCSAALLPAVSSRMEALFSRLNADALPCVVVATYAMTESMPISSNPRDAARRQLGSVGCAAGPAVRILSMAHAAVLDAGGDRAAALLASGALDRRVANTSGAADEGEVCVKGACVTAGYETRDWMHGDDPNDEAFVGGAAGPRSWLRTGDKGMVDDGSAGHLSLSGRFKEIINRGGEKISPFAVEDVLLRHAAVENCVCFSAPHAQLGEVVGAAIVLKPGRVTDLKAVRDWCTAGVGSDALLAKWAPEVLVFVAAIPKGPTGKPARIRLAQRLGMPALDAAAPAAMRVECYDVGDAALLDKEGAPDTMRAATTAHAAMMQRAAADSASSRGRRRRGAPVDGADSADSMALFSKVSPKRDGRAHTSPRGDVDSMALFAPGAVAKPAAARVSRVSEDGSDDEASPGSGSSSDDDQAEEGTAAAMQGHLYFAAMLGILLTHGLPAHRSSLWPLHANIGAGYGLELFFTFAGVADLRKYHALRRCGRSKSSCWQTIKPYAVVYCLMVLLDVWTHVLYECLRRTYGLKWNGAKAMPYIVPVRPSLVKTKWFVGCLGLMKIGGYHLDGLEPHGRARRLAPYAAGFVAWVFGAFVDADAKVGIPNAGLGAFEIARLNAMLCYFYGPFLMPLDVATPQCSAMSRRRRDAGMAFAVVNPRSLCRKARRPPGKSFDSDQGGDDVEQAGLVDGDDGSEDGAPPSYLVSEHNSSTRDVFVFRLSPTFARHATLGVILMRLLATQTVLGYDSDRALPKTLYSPNAATTVLCALRAACKGGGFGALRNPGLRLAFRAAGILVNMASLASTAYWSPQGTSIWSNAGNASLFAYLWHRALIPPLTALVVWLYKSTKADALIALPVFLAFQLFISQPFPPVADVKKFAVDAALRAWPTRGRARRGDAPRWGMLVHPLPVFAVFFVAALSAWFASD